MKLSKKMFKGLRVEKLKGLLTGQCWQSFTCADFINLFNRLTIKPFNPKTLAFTMAEILISLTIIGVIAAITLPTLMANINERIWDTQRKALYTRVSQAMSLMPSVGGYGEWVGTWHTGSCPSDKWSCDDYFSVSKDTATITFVTQGLSKVMKLNNICSFPYNATDANARNALKKCGLVDKFKTSNNFTVNMPKNISQFDKSFTARYNGNCVGKTNCQPDTGYFEGMDTASVGVETANGESLLVMYKPNCLPKPDKQAVKFVVSQYKYHDYSSLYKWLQHEAGVWSQYYTQSSMCVNFIYDLNGPKGPNKIYKDMGFITVFYPSDPVTVAPVIKGGKYNVPKFNDALKYCEAHDKSTRFMTFDEAKSVFVNKELLGVRRTYGQETGNILSDHGIIMWGGSDAIINDDYAWGFDGHGWSFPVLKDLTNSGSSKHYSVLCVKR